MEPSLILGGSIVIITVAVIIAAVVLDAKRAGELAVAATALKLTFQKKGSPDIVQALREFRLFQHGHGKQIRNLMSGSAMNMDLQIFDYSYTVSGGKNNTVISQTVICFTSPDLNLPVFELSPETLFHRIGEAFVGSDIDFAEHPVFSKQYRLKGPDESAVRELFRRDVCEYFEARTKLSVEGQGHILLFYRHGKRVKAPALQDFMAEGFEVLGLFKN